MNCVQVLSLRGKIMILSVSRRTDIPAYYGEWFANRIKEQYVLVRNPMNYHSISRINLSPSVVDCIVFWTKNVEPFLPYLATFEKQYTFYFQYTLNAYEDDVEKNIPSLETRLDSLKKLSSKYGQKNVIWRYDPIMISEKYNLAWHIDRFKYLCATLSGYVNTCVFSFIDIYAKNSSKLGKLRIREVTELEKIQVAKEFSSIAEKYNIQLKTCTENIDLSKYGIEKSCCVDPKLVEELIGCNIVSAKDKNQRVDCGCVGSVDIGQYNTCANGCIYCYASYSPESVSNNMLKHNPDSALLLGEVEPNDKIHERELQSLKSMQLSLF